MDHEEFACIVCQESALGFALPTCGHKSLCLRCYLSNVTLFRNNTCPICKVRQQRVILASDPSRSHADYDTRRIPYSKKLKLHCATNDLKRVAESFLAFTCARCNFEAPKMAALRAHMQQEHKLDMCTTCVRRRKVFPREQRLYGEKALRAHKKSGDQATDTEAPIPVHVKCELCNDWLFDEDDLVAHQREAHIMCQVCRRQRKQVWLKGNPHLLQHYREAHIVCTEADCILDDLENVFMNEIDFQTHILNVHSSGRDRRLARLVNLDIRYQPHAPAGSTGAGRPQEAQESKSASVGDLSAFPSLGGEGAPATVSWNFEGDLASQNRQLMGALRATLGDAGLQHFRSLSAAYLEGRCSAEEYYQHFCALFVGTSAPVSSIWMNLVGLLPDFNKRTELYEVHHRAVREGRRFDQRQQEEGEVKEGCERPSAEPTQAQRGEARRQRSKKGGRGRNDGAARQDGGALVSDLASGLEQLQLGDISEVFQAWASSLALLLSRRSANVTLQPHDLRLGEADEHLLQTFAQNAGVRELLSLQVLERIGFNPATRAAIAKRVGELMGKETRHKDCLKDDEGLQSVLEACTPRELFLLRKYARHTATARPPTGTTPAQADGGVGPGTATTAAAATATTAATMEERSRQAQEETRPAEAVQKKPKRKGKQLLMKIGL